MQVAGGRIYLLWEVLYIAEVNTITGSWQEDYFWFQSRLHSKDGSKLSAIQDSGSKPWEMGCCFDSFVQRKFSNICHRNITWRAAIFVTAVSNVTANKTRSEKQLCSQRQTLNKKAGRDKALQMNVGQVNIIYMQYILILYYIMSLSPIPYMWFYHQHKDYSLWSSYIISPLREQSRFLQPPRGVTRLISEVFNPVKSRWTKSGLLPGDSFDIRILGEPVMSSFYFCVPKVLFESSIFQLKVYSTVTGTPYVWEMTPVVISLT